MMESLSRQVARSMLPGEPETKEIVVRVEEISTALLYPLAEEERENARRKFLEAFKTQSPEERAKTIRAVVAITETLEKRKDKNIGFNGALIRQQLENIKLVAEMLKASDQT